MFKLFSRYTAGYRRFIGWNILFNLFTVAFGIISMGSVIPFLQILFGLTPPELTKPVFQWWDINGWLKLLDYGLSQLINTQGKEMALIWVSIGVVVVFFLKNFFRYLAMASITPMRNGISSNIRIKLYNHYIQLPLAFFSHRKRGDLVSRVTSDVQEIEWSILNSIEVVSREPLAILGSLVVMVAVSPKLVLSAFILMGFIGVIIGGIGKALKKQSSEAQGLIGQLNASVEEGISGLRVVRGYHAEDYFKGRFEYISDKYRRLNNKLLWRRDLSSPLSEFLGIAVMAILLWFGAGMVFSGELQPDKFIFFLMMFYNIISPAKALSSATYNIRKGMGASERVESVLSEQKELPGGGDQFERFEHSIEFKGVGFHYDHGRQVLENVSFSIPKGKTVALVGASGSGKSTLADLLAGFHDTTSGEILVDGRALGQFSKVSWRENLALVSQHPILFHDTAEMNITLGKKYHKDEVIAASVSAHADEFITAMPLGYETLVGDGGGKLSGGQRQRITIARAILRNPQLLILDEATSALDVESEALVQESLEKLMQGRTTLVIAHKMATIKNADIIVFLDEGKVVEIGTHHELMAKKGRYFDWNS